MKLKIENVAKIERAEIELNGITVIAGNNNTGKSTIGKVVFSLYNSLSDIEVRLSRQKEQLIYKQLRQTLEETSREEEGYYYPVSPTVLRNSARELRECDSEPERLQIIRRLLSKKALRLEEKTAKTMAIKLADGISEINNLPTDRLTKSVVSAYFNQIFYGNICNVNQREARARIEAIIRGKKIVLDFMNETCKEMEQDVEILSKAFYLDNPFVLNRLNSGLVNDEIERVLLRSLRQERDAVEDAVQYNITSDKIQGVIKLLDSVTEGSIFADESHEYLFRQRGTDALLNVNNLSAGLKSFVIIKMLLENHSLRERDVLILDEPEIHLHPEWQMKYAEIIILLQKEFNLTVILATHSSHFLEALQLYAKKYGTEEKCSYYLTEYGDYGYVLNNMTDDITKIYSQLIDPSIILNKMRYEAEETEDEQS